MSKARSQPLERNPERGSTQVGSGLAFKMRLGCKRLLVTNGLPYYDPELITTAKIVFVILGPCVNRTKPNMITTTQQVKIIYIYFVKLR
jgi:hypothetical protein